MKNKNICKIIEPAVSGKLEMINFVYETSAVDLWRDKVLESDVVILVSCGMGSLEIDGRMLDFGVGSLLFAFEGERISVRANSCELMYVSYTGTRREELYTRLGISGYRRSFAGYEGLIPIWRDSLARSTERTADLAAEGVLLHTLSRLDCDNSGREDTVGRLLSCIEERFEEPSLTLSLISAEMGYNEKYLSHLFKSRIGVSFTEHLRNKRISYAVLLFEHGLDSVKNVAFLSGFSDPLYFSTVFKRSLGVSPKEFIDRMKVR